MLESSPLTRLQLFNPDNRMENYLSPEQLDKLVTVLRTAPPRTVCNVALFLLATGARLNEALRARWDQIDKDNRVWKIPASNSKSKRIRSVPLNDAALEVLGQLGTEGKYDNLFIIRQDARSRSLMSTKSGAACVLKPAWTGCASTTCATAMPPSWSTVAVPCTRCSRSSATATQGDRAVCPPVHLKPCRRRPTRPASSSRARGRRRPSPPAALAPQRPPGGHRPAPGATPPRSTRLGPLASVCGSGMAAPIPRPPRGASGQGLRPGSPAPSALPRPSPAQLLAQ